MPISAGAPLGSYELLAQIGAGGMGEVYKAHDTKLGRDVAIKILPEAFAHDSDRLARFQREAKMLASLNHPNIATIYGLEYFNATHFLIMELVPGETLAERITREGPVPVEEALKVAVQIAEALEAAHEKGIIHRDLKPANVKVTPEGKVKVLDFGLAKAFAGDTTDSNPSQSPTLSALATMHGVILGTAAYMSPEQARGKAVDKRTDIWALGCVLYETLTGKQAFEGEDITEILAAVVKSEPDWKLLPPKSPAKIRDLLRRCLQKDRTLRMQAAGDVRIEIQEALAAPATPEAMGVVASRLGWTWRQAALWGVVAVTLLAIGGIAVWNLKSAPGSSHTVTRLAVALPLDEQLNFTLTGSAIALSPDGTQLAYTATRGGVRQLYVRSMDSLDGKPISGTDGAAAPFFSPDGQWVGFFADRKLKKVAISGGSPLVVCDAPEGGFGGSWGANDTIFFAPASVSGIWRVSAKGGIPQPFTTLDQHKGEISHRWPQVLPGGKAILFTAWTGPGWDEQQVQLQMLGSGVRRVLVQGGHLGRYVPTGHIVYLREGSLLAVPFDSVGLEVIASTPIPIIENVRDRSDDIAPYTVSDDGSLAYVPGSPHQFEGSLVWVDRRGKSEPLAAPLRPYQSLRLSPDGQQVALMIDGPKVDIWLYSLARGISTRLTSEAGSSQFPIWTPDGKRLTYRGTRVGTRNLFWRMADGTGAEERLTTGESNQAPSSWSPDGQVLAFTDQSPTTGSRVLLLRLAERQQQPLHQSTFSELTGRFSPDGRWLAYSSDESGRSEIYVEPYPASAGKSQVSTEGGVLPVWSRNGRELFYRNENKIMTADITTQPSFSAGEPRMLFQGEYGGYDVSPDGQRFLMIKPSEQTSSTSLNQVVVVQNWFEELKRRVPTGK
jgi:eukaryotic-like serine/threonine-protein kinase